VQNTLGAAAAKPAQLCVKPGLVPACLALGLALGKVRLHVEAGDGQVERVLVHGRRLFVLFGHRYLESQRNGPVRRVGANAPASFAG